MNWYKMQRYLERNSATILTGLGVAGVVGTAVTAIRATPKAIYILEKKEKEKGAELSKYEKVLATAPIYIPTILMGTTTIICILSANKLNKERQAMLTSAYAYLNNSYNEYKTTVKELYGDDADDKIQAEIAKKRYEERLIPEDSEKKLFYDQFSKRYFETTEEDLLKAIYNLNRQYSMYGEITLNDFYKKLDLEETDYGGVLGWSYARDLELFGYSWIDIHWELIDMPDGLQAYAITFPIDPSEDYYGY